jgi:hypothetical protein
MKEYVDIYGSGKNATIIQTGGSGTGPSSDSSSATVVGANNASIRNLTIQSDSSAQYATGIYNNNVSPIIENLAIKVNTTYSSGSPEVYGIYQQLGNTAISNVEITSNNAVTSGYAYGIFFDNVSNSTTVRQSSIKAAGGESAIGIMNNNNSEPNFQYINILVNSANNNYGVYNQQSTPTFNYVDLLIDGNAGNTLNCAFYNYSSNPIINNTIGRVLVLSQPNYGIYNYYNSKPELHNVTFDVKNGSTNQKIYNTDTTSSISLSATNYIGSITANAAELSQITIKSNAYLVTSMTFQGNNSNDLYETTIKVEEPTKANTITFPDESGTVMLSGDGGDVVYSSVTAQQANYNDITINNALVLKNLDYPSGNILISSSAALPQQITIPDISGTVVVTEKQGANGQAIVSDGSGGYTWQTLNNGLTHEITVGEGGDYTTITEAIDSITDNNILNHYVIKVSPGIFEEQIKMKEYVEIKGSGKNATIIKSVGSDSGVYTAATVIGGNDTAISNLSIHCMTSANYAVGIYNSGDSLLIDNLIIIVMTSSVSAETYGIYQYSGSTAISNVGITSSVAGISGNCFGIYFENVSDKTVLKHSVIEAAGGAWACGIHNINASPSIQHTNISVRLANGYNYGIWNDSYATPTINHVDIKVSGIFGSYENLAINNSYSSPIVKNTAGDVLVSSSGSNYGIMNNNESKPELHNVTLNVKNGSTNLQIYNMDALSKIILNATTYTGNLNADSAELTQITIKSNAYLLTSMTFQGYSSTDGKETIIKITEPTQSNTIRFPDASGTVMLSGGSGGTLDVSSVTANAGTYTEMTVSNQISVSKTTISGDIMLADEYSPISGNTTPADTALYYGDKDTDGAWRMVRIGESLVMQRRESGVWVSKMSVNP